MTLVLRAKNVYIGTSPPSASSNIRVSIEKSSLSIPYELGEEAEIYGKIISVRKRNGEILKDIPAIDVKFLLKSANISQDSLYISEESWTKIRDYGILPEHSIIDVLLYYLIYEGKRVDIYPKRNVEL